MTAFFESLLRTSASLPLRRLLIYCLFASSAISCNQTPTAPIAEITIVPKPQSISISDEESFLISNSTRYFISNEQAVEALLWLTQDIPLGKALSAEDAEIIYALDSTLGTEEYTISSSSSGIYITAGSSNGFLHASASLKQILIPHAHGQEEWQLHIPTFSISDKPNFAWRGMLLDCCRHFMEKDFVKRYIDLLALYKMNTLHWHLTEDQGWRIEIEKYPKLTTFGAWRKGEDGKPYGGFYSKEDIREIVKYAADRGINVVPEIELPGHSQAALAAYPQLSCTGGPHEVETEWGVFKEIYCAGNDSTFVFLKDVLTEVMELFPSQYIHIGGDEAPKFRWEHCAKCQKRINQEGLHNEHELQSWFISQIGEFLAEYDRRLIGWDEILEGGLPKGAIVQSWRGFEGASAAVKAGHQAIVSPTSHAYFDYDISTTNIEKVYSFNPIPEDIIGTPDESAILGGECNMWTERAPQHLVDSKVFPRILAMSEVLWSPPESRDLQDFETRLQYHYRILDSLDIDYGYERSPLNYKIDATPNQVVVGLVPGIKNASLFSTTDGSIPTTQGITDTSIVLLEDAVITSAFFRGEKQVGEVIRQSFGIHQALGTMPVIEQQFGENYTAGGAGGLTDGKRGSTNFRDGNWQGYWGSDISGTIVLDTAKTIAEVKMGFLQYNNAWIFLPQYIQIEGSLDGTNWIKLGQTLPKASPKQKGEFTENMRIEFAPRELQFVRFEVKNLGKCPPWHDAAGSDAWIFIDEIVVR